MLYFVAKKAYSGSCHGLPGEESACASLFMLEGNIDCRTFAMIPLFGPAFWFCAVPVLVLLQFQ
jgi:hypothetical protein